VSFVTAGATVKLPAATTAGQQVILIIATNGFTSGFSVEPGSGDSIFDYYLSDGAQDPDGPYWSMILISDGNHHWFLVSAG
jgi:hypothetical protein